MASIIIANTLNNLMYLNYFISFRSCTIRIEFGPVNVVMRRILWVIRRPPTGPLRGLFLTIGAGRPQDIAATAIVAQAGELEQVVGQPVDIA